MTNANTEVTPDAEHALLGEALEIPLGNIVRVTREPLGAGSVTGYDVTATEPGALELRYYVDTSRLSVRQETGMTLGAPKAPDVRIWQHPVDPHLPSLAAVAFHRAAESLLARIGIGSSVAAAVDPEFVAYRPGRRAVLRVQADGRTIWIKIVRPSRVARISDAHGACERAGLPVPSLAAWSPEGVILLEQAAGTPAADVVWDPEQLLDQVDALRTQIAGVEVTEETRGVAGRLDWYAAGLNDQDRARRIAHSTCTLIDNATADSAEPRFVQVVHGDLHFGQLFLTEGAISGVIDVDTLGVGDPAEDSAAFLAHATASALMSAPGARERVGALAENALERWGGDPVVRAYFAIHMLGHAVGAESRADVSTADQLLRAAEQVLAGGRIFGTHPAMEARSQSKNALTNPLDSP